VIFSLNQLVNQSLGCSIVMKKLCWAVLGGVISSTTLAADVEIFWQIQNQFTVNDFDASAANNPENQILQLNDYSGFVELQPEILFNWKDLSFNLQPRINLNHQNTTIVSEDKSETDTDLSLNYWQVEYYHDDFWVKGGRYVNLWGPARLVSPSNRYHVNTNRSNPEVELDARDYIEIGGALNDQWQILLTTNVGRGDQLIEHFKVTADLQLEWVGEESSSTLIFSKTALGYGVGGYAQWTVNEALLLYTDLYYQNKVQNINSEAEPENFSIVNGVSYTLENGLNFTVDYLYNQQGLSENELNNLFNLNNQYTADILRGDIEPRKIGYITQVNNLASYTVSQHYLFTMLQQNEVIDDVDFSLLHIKSLNDNSRTTLNLAYRLNDDLRLYSSFSWFSGGSVSDQGRFLKQNFSAGAKYIF